MSVARSLHRGVARDGRREQRSGSRRRGPSALPTLPAPGQGPLPRGEVGGALSEGTPAGPAVPAAVGPPSGGWRQTRAGLGPGGHRLRSHSECRGRWRQRVSQTDASLLKVWEGSLQIFCRAKPGLPRELGPGSLCAGPECSPRFPLPEGPRVMNTQIRLRSLCLSLLPTGRTSPRICHFK